MTFTVTVSDRAEADLRAATEWIARNAPETAARWVNGFHRALRSLESNPRRCGHANEHQKVPFELRQLLYGRRRNYRAIFTIRENEVVVLAIRHAAQQDLSADDLSPRD
jgi:plasmid stabilization system protein ParE